MSLIVRKPVFRVSIPQNCLLSYIDKLEILSFACNKLRYDSFQYANNKGAVQTGQAGRRLCCLQTAKTGFLTSRTQHFTGEQGRINIY